METTAGCDVEGRLETVQYPAGGQLYKYSFDSMGMPSKLRDQTNAVDVVGGVTYELAGEMLTFEGSESRSDNVNGQMTTLNLPGRTINYNFPAAGANNGKVVRILLQNDHRSSARSITRSPSVRTGRIRRWTLQRVSSRSTRKRGEDVRDLLLVHSEISSSGRSIAEFRRSRRLP